jgi:hypothetical protein
MLAFDDADDDVDDSELLEDEDDDKAFLVELQRLAEQAQELVQA